MQMNSPEGKAILALVREGDFAHAGEQAAIELCFAALSKDPAREVLDIGCGRGGTAEHLRRGGWGRVTGVDIDAESIAYARRQYPRVHFVAADALEIGDLWPGRFDLGCLFNVFYALPAQAKALGAIARAARPGAQLMLFDYTDRTGALREKADSVLGDWSPIDPGTIAAGLARCGWRMRTWEDVTPRYRDWYQGLCARIAGHEAGIRARHGQDWYTYVHGFYAHLLHLIERGLLGGAILWAERA